MKLTNQAPGAHDGKDATSKKVHLRAPMIRASMKYVGLHIGWMSNKVGVVAAAPYLIKRSPTEKNSSSYDSMRWPYPISVTTPPANLETNLTPTQNWLWTGSHYRAACLSNFPGSSKRPFSKTLASLSCTARYSETMFLPNASLYIFLCRV